MVRVAEMVFGPRKGSSFATTLRNFGSVSSMETGR